MTGSQRAKRQQQSVFTTQDITIIDSPAVVDGVLMIEFIVGGHNGMSTISSREMAAVIESEGARLAEVLGRAVSSVIQYRLSCMLYMWDWAYCTCSWITSNLA